MHVSVFRHLYIKYIKLSVNIIVTLLSTDEETKLARHVDSYLTRTVMIFI